MDVTSYLLGKNASGGGSADDKYFNKTITSYFNGNKETLVGQQIIKELPSIDLSTAITSLDYAFQYFRVMIKAPNLNTKNVMYMRYMFDYCNQLRELPIYDTSSLLDMGSAFRYCNNLTDSSLDNILVMCINAKSYNSTKTLSSLRISSSEYPVSRIEALPHYQDFIDADWTIGY